VSGTPVPLQKWRYEDVGSGDGGGEVGRGGKGEGGRGGEDQLTQSIIPS